MVGAPSGPEPSAANDGWAEPAGEIGGAVPAASYGAGPVYPSRSVRLVSVPLRLLKASEQNLDDLFRELQMADIAAVSSSGVTDGPIGAHRDTAEATLAKLVPLADIVKTGLAELRVQARRAIWEAARRGDGVVNLDLYVDPRTPPVFEVLDELVTGAAAAARSGYLLTEPPNTEVVAFRLWARDEIVGQIAGEPATSCPFPVAVDEAPSAK